MIIHDLSKLTKGFLALFIVLLAPLSGEAQLSEEEQINFDKKFFEAERLKLIEEHEEAYEVFEKCLDIDPNNAAVNYELAITDLENHRYELALERAEKAVANDSSNYWYYRLLGSIYYQRGESEKRLKTLSKIVSLVPKNPEFRAEYIQALLEAESFQKAIIQLDTLEQIVGPTEKIIEQKKKLYLFLNDAEGAASEIQKLIDLNPRDVNAYGMLAQLYMNDRQSEKALSVYEKLLKINPKEPRAHLNLAEYYRSIDEVEKSVYHLKIALRNPELSIDTKVSVMLTFFKLIETAPAYTQVTGELLDSIVAAHPNDPKGYSLQGDYFEQVNEPQKARKAFKKTGSLPGGSQVDILNRVLFLDTKMGLTDSIISDANWVQEYYPSQPFSYLVKGLAYIEKEEYKTAIVVLEDGRLFAFGDRAIQEQFHLYLAEAYYREKNYQRSDENFEAALEINPTNPTGLNNYAYYLSERGEKLQRALECTERSNQLSPNKPIFLDTHAWVLFKMKKYPEALTIMQKVIALTNHPTGDVFEHYGDILYFNNKLEEAIEAWNKAKNLGGASDKVDQKIQTKTYVE